MRSRDPASHHHGIILPSLSKTAKAPCSRQRSRRGPAELNRFAHSAGPYCIIVASCLCIRKAGEVASSSTLPELSCDVRAGASSRMPDGGRLSWERALHPSSAIAVRKHQTATVVDHVQMLMPFLFLSWAVGACLGLLRASGRLPGTAQGPLRGLSGASGGLLGASGGLLVAVLDHLGPP